MWDDQIKVWPQRHSQILNLVPALLTITVIFDTLDHIDLFPGMNLICLCSEAFQQLLTMANPFTGKEGVLLEMSSAKLNEQLVVRTGGVLRMQGQADRKSTV